MSGVCKQGFGLIEILIALAIIALVGTTVVPLLWRTDPRQARRDLLSRVNELVGFAQQQAVITGINHQVEWDFKKGTVSLTRASDKRTSEGKPVFEPLKEVAINTEIKWPKNLEVKQFILEGFDEMTRSTMGKTTGAWFFVLPDGMTQAVIINLTDKNDGIRGGRGRQVGWVLNPFSAQFKEYDEFQR